MAGLLGRWLLIGALVVSTGGHWAFLQVCAWTGMVISYSRNASLSEAISMTPLASVIATHGRGFYIMDDLTRLYNAPSATPTQPHLFAPRRTYRILPDLVGSWVPSEGRIYGLGLGSAAGAGDGATTGFGFGATARGLGAGAAGGDQVGSSSAVGVGARFNRD